jgi:signal transduction histidine kinase
MQAQGFLRWLPLREWQVEEARMVAMVTRALLAAITLGIYVDSLARYVPLLLAFQALLLAYLSFSVSLIVANLFYWVSNFRLGRIARIFDEILCGLTVLLFPTRPEIYLSFTFFLMAAPSGKYIRARVAVEYIALVALSLAHNRLFEFAEARWPGSALVQPVDTQATTLQIAMISIAALTVLAFRLGSMARVRISARAEALIEEHWDARTLPLLRIADALGGEFAVDRVLFALRPDRSAAIEVVIVEGGEMRRANVPPEQAVALCDLELPGSCLFWDRSNGFALGEGKQGAARLIESRTLALPDAAIEGGARICALRLEAGLLTGFAYLVGVRRISEPQLQRAIALAAAISGSLGRQQLLNIWRDRAFAQARLAMSRDMHDSVLQTLAGLRMRIASMLGHPLVAGDADIRGKLDDLQSIISAEQACIREILFDSDPKETRTGLVEHLRQRLELLARQWNVRCALDSQIEELEVKGDMAAEVEFLVREAISNAVQHARAKSIHVAVAMQDDELLITIRNDGRRGTLLDSGSAHAEGVASRSLQRRLKMLGATAYEDPMESGALLSLRIPVELGLDV